MNEAEVAELKKGLARIESIGNSLWCCPAICEGLQFIVYQGVIEIFVKFTSCTDSLCLFTTRNP